ncbi:DEAD/DEAH box helicase [Priestia sp. D51]
MERNIGNELFNKLYDYQKESLLIVEKYLRSTTKKHALIKMPTGTGKTILIAYISNYFEKYKNILLVSPSKAVTEQLERELKTSIPNNFKLVKKFKDVEKLYPSNVEDLLKTKASTIFICTAKSLNDIREQHPPYFEILKKKINLIIFDEGHREPADKWKHTIRDFNKKVLLFTATPLRNDNNNFHLDNKYIYNYPFHKAIEDNKIRRPTFTEYKGEEKLEDFIDYVHNKVQHFMNSFNSNPKVILRFDNVMDIIKAKEILNKKNIEVVAIHNTFKNNIEEGFYKDVPDTKGISINYWLHQNKLIEGIDDDSFSILAIYHSFNDVRSLIQQVGRIVRKNNSISSSIVIFRNDKVNQEKLFTEYMHYEIKLEKNKNLINFNYDDYFNKVLSYHPSHLHINQRFLEKINYLKVELDEEYLMNFRLPLKTNIFYSKLGIKKFESYCESIINNLLNGEGAKIIYELKNIDSLTFVIVYSVYRNSPYLVNNYFIEPKLGIAIFKINRDLIFYYDSNDNIPMELLYENEKVAADDLQKLFDKDSIFKQVTINSGFVANSVRRQTLFTENMDSVSPSITDKYKFCTTVQGTDEGHDARKRTRYIGFGNARVSDSGNLFLLKEYLSWIDYLAQKLKTQNNKLSIFERYAPKTKTPSNLEALNVLIDIDESLRGELMDSNNNIVFLDNLSFSVANNEFTIKHNEHQYNVKVEFDRYNFRYYLKKVGKWDIYININHQKKDLISYLNKTQNLQVLTKDCESVYCKGNFYKIGISNEDNRLKDILIEYEPKREIIFNEKGKYYKKASRLSITKPKWDYNSLFYLIANLGRNLNQNNKGSSEIHNTLKNLDYLICTDLETEVADFIGLDENNKSVYFIHCKAGKNQLSATAFQDVCTQIIKNLDYVNPLSTRIPSEVDKWGNDWAVSSYCVKKNRMIINPKGTSSKDIWEKIKKISRLQESNVYVWAMLGNMFSKQNYLDNKKKGAIPEPELIQIDYLLMSTWAAVQNSNAKFKVFFDKK